VKRKKDSLSACAWREAAWPQSADETTRAIVAEREGLDAASNIPHVGMSQPHGCFCVLIEAFEGLRVTHEKQLSAFRQDPLPSSPILPPDAGE